MPNPYVVVDTIPDSDEWREERRRSIGASDVPNVLNLPGSFGTPLEVFRSKMGVDKEFDAEQMDIGHWCEAVMGQWLVKYHPEIGVITSGFMARSTISPHIHATFDRMADGVPVQMKTVHYAQGQKWELDPPLAVQAQVQTEMFVSGHRWQWVAAFIGGKRFELYRVERDQRFIDRMVPRVERFWDEHVAVKVEPEPVTTKEAANLWVADGSVFEVPPADWEAIGGVWERYRELQFEGKSVADDMEAIKLPLQVAMGAAEIMTINRQPVFTWKPTKTGRAFRRVNIKETR